MFWSRAVLTDRIVVAAWNLVEPDQKGTTQHLRLEFRNVNAGAPVLIRRVDEKHSNSLAAYRTMGSPWYPTQTQIEQLNRESALAPAEITTLKNGCPGTSCADRRTGAVRNSAAVSFCVPGI